MRLSLLPRFVALAVTIAVIGTRSYGQLGDSAPTSRPSLQEDGAVQPLMLDSGVAWSLVTGDDTEFRKLTRQLQVSEPYIRLSVADELVDLVRGTAGYTLPGDKVRRPPQQVLRQLVEAWTGADIDKPPERADEAAVVAYLSYKAGVIAQSGATRRASDTGALAERYRPRILDGLKNFRSGPRGFRALQELLTVWPPLGATPVELRQVSGIDGEPDHAGVLTVVFDDGRGLGAVGVRFIFVDGRLSRIGYWRGA
jgi:hypothetical protein